MVSTNHALVVSSEAAAKPSVSVVSTNRTSIPKRRNVCRKMFQVPP